MTTRSRRLIPFAILRLTICALLASPVVATQRAPGDTIIADIAYAPEHGERGLLDVMLPEGEGPFPVVVCIHGGGWRRGDKSGGRRMAGWLRELGIASVLPNYRLSTDAPFPAQRDDILAVMNWVAENAEVYGFDLDRVGLTGGSAGGHLATLVGVLVSRNPDPRYRIRCIGPNAAVADLRAATQLPPGDRGREMVELLVGGPVEEHTDLLAEASPMAHVHANVPPIMFFHGQNDPLIPAAQIVALVDTLRSLGVDARAHIVQGAGHSSFGRNPDPERPAAAVELFRAFFREHLVEETSTSR